MTFSPDERFAYVASLDDSVAIFRRDLETGVLTQLPGEAGCITPDGAQGCARGRGILGPHRFTITTDGLYAYLASKQGSSRKHNSALAVFRRNIETGELIQLDGLAGCVTEHEDAGCARGRVIRGAHAALLDLDETTIFLSSDRAEGGIAVFRRDPETGEVKQLDGERGCMSPIAWQGCSIVRRTGGIHILVMTRDGRHVYAAGEGQHAVTGYRLVKGVAPD